MVKKFVNVSDDLIKLKLIPKKKQERQIKKLVKSVNDLISHNISVVIQEEAIPHLIDLVMKGYDDLSSRMDKMPFEDPTDPSLWRDEFKALLEKDAADTFRFDPESGTVKVEIGERRALGYIDGESEAADTDSDTPLVWMVYYLEGLAGSWGWVTKDLYEQVFPEGTWNPEWGRFKSAPGFMISATEFFLRERPKRFGGGPNPWIEKVTWEEIRHPFSAFSPVDIFAEALNEFRIRPFVEKAIRAAKAGRRL